ncbi:DUF7344 domain-containing protein [Haladaptatus sp. NG-WS-4]
MSATAVQQSRSSLGADGPTELTQDVAFQLLSNQLRRHIMHYLLQQDGPVSLHELSKRLAAWENDVSFDEVTYKQLMRVYTAIRQSHLPKMDDGGIVEFDSNAGEVRLTEAATKLEVYLDIVPHNGIPWSSYYLGLGGLSAALVTTAWFELFPFNLLPDIAWGLVVTVLFVVSALAHRHHDHENRLGQEGRPPA